MNIKTGQISFVGDTPMDFASCLVEDSPSISKMQESVFRQVGATVKAYLVASEELLNGKYAHLREWAPPHLADPGKVLAACCPDGVVIRYERKKDEQVLATGWIPKQLTDVVPLLSQQVVYCYGDRPYVSRVPTTGSEIRLSVVNAGTNKKQDIAVGRVGFDCVIERPDHLPQPPQKPFCLLSVRNAFEFQLHGELIGEQGTREHGQRFLARTEIRLPVGWECIEVFPFFDLEHWKPEYSAVWAENDLLAAVVARQFRDQKFASLDPHASARREYAKQLRAYKDLIDSDPEREEILQSFLRDHAPLLCPAHTKMWPKLALGARKTDFVFKDATNDYLLVELEPSTHRLFRKDGQRTAVLTHAMDQVTDWIRYLEDNLPTVQRELGLDGISSKPRSLIVLGRSRSLSAENRRKLVTIENMIPSLRIMTYDDIYDMARAVGQNLLGPLWEPGGNTQIYYLPSRGA